MLTLSKFVLTHNSADALSDGYLNRANVRFAPTLSRFNQAANNECVYGVLIAIHIMKNVLATALEKALISSAFLHIKILVLFLVANSSTMTRLPALASVSKYLKRAM